MGIKGQGSDSAPEYYRIVSDQDAVLPLARVKLIQRYLRDDSWLCCSETPKLISELTPATAGKPVLPAACNVAEGLYCNSRASVMLEMKRKRFYDREGN